MASHLLLSAFLPPVTIPRPPRRDNVRISASPRTLRLRVHASQKPDAPLPNWTRLPLTPPGVPTDVRASQWEYFKLHIANWVGDWTSYKQHAGPPYKVVQSIRRFELQPTSPHGIECVHQTNLLLDATSPNNTGAHRDESHYRYFGSTPPSYVQALRPNGVLAPQPPGIFFFTPHGAAGWVMPTITGPRGKFFMERYLLHPHLPGVRLTIATIIAANGVQLVSLIREEARVDRTGFPDKGAYSSAMDAKVIQKTDLDKLSKGTFSVVKHVFEEKNMIVVSNVREAQGLPTLPAGEDRVVMQLPDGVVFSLPRRIGIELDDRDMTLEILWQLDRGSWLHSQVVYNSDGKFDRDCMSVYYPL